MPELCAKSKHMTAYLEHLLLDGTTDAERQFDIITPSDPKQRGAQLSVLLKPGLLASVSKKLQANGIVADQREPGVVRVAPVPLYNTYMDCWTFARDLKAALPQ